MTKHNHSGHRQRMKERCRKEGLDSFAEHELLEYMLDFTIPQKDTNDTGHLLLQEFGSFAGVLDADFEALCNVKGIGEHTASFLTMFPALFRAYQKSRWQNRVEFADTKTVASYLFNQFVGETNEVFYLLCLDAQGRLICPCRVSEGTWNSVPVYTSEVVRLALMHKARAVILAHNHPGGSPRPTSSDIELTKRIMEALALVDVVVREHMIIAGEQYFSFAEKGYLEDLKR